LQERFDYVRNRSLHFSRSLEFGSTGLLNDFLVLIDIFHFAGLLYSFQALLSQDEFAPTRQAFVSCVVRTIGQIKISDAFQHDLVWPLFLVGAESRNNREAQGFVETKLLEAMQSTGFSNCRPALEFLQRFWNTDPALVTNWMQFARQESKQGSNFL